MWRSEQDNEAEFLSSCFFFLECKIKSGSEFLGITKRSKTTKKIET